MFDAVHMQRSAGMAEIAMDRGRLTGLSQSGSAKVMLPLLLVIPVFVLIRADRGAGRTA